VGHCYWPQRWAKNHLVGKSKHLKAEYTIVKKNDYLQKKWSFTEPRNNLQIGIAIGIARLYPFWWDQTRRTKSGGVSRCAERHGWDLSQRRCCPDARAA